MTPDVETNVDTLIADLNVRPGYELLHVVLRFVAERAPENYRGRWLRRWFVLLAEHSGCPTLY